MADAKANNQRIVLEDLDGIRETGKAKCVHEWSFAELQWMIRYKAAKAGVEVGAVSPRYTSQTCSRCLHLYAWHTKNWMKRYGTGSGSDRVVL